MSDRAPARSSWLHARLQKLQPLDRSALAAMLVLVIFVGGLALAGERSAPRVVDFSWQGKRVGAGDRSFILTFSRPMDVKSVEENLSFVRISEEGGTETETTLDLAGKISWAGQRMAYTLRSPLPYGGTYEARLQEARDRYSEQGKEKKIQPFAGRFQTRDRALLYIGMSGEEAGRLILANFADSKVVPLTPPDLKVVNFKPYPDGDRVLLGAVDRDRADDGSTFVLTLYTTTTGLGSRTNEEAIVGRLDLLLSSDRYQNLKYDLAPDGKTIVVQRIDRQTPSGTLDVWVLREGEDPYRLKTPPGGEFVIAPDGNTLAIAQGQGIALLPLDKFSPDETTGVAVEPLDFLPNFGQVLDFTSDGARAAMVQYNGDFTRSLYLVTTQGEETEILRTDGSIRSGRFDAADNILYCLLTELVEGRERYSEKPYVAAYSIASKEWKRLWDLPEQVDLSLALAPDNLSFAFDRLEAGETPLRSRLQTPRTVDGRAIADARLWLLPLAPNDDPNAFPEALPPEELPLAGIRPAWVP